MTGIVRFGTIGACALLLAACARPPTAELTSYRLAFDGFRSSTDALVEVYAPIERAERAPDPGETFDPNTAIYFATTGEPPISGYLRRGVRVIDRFNDVLVTYAEGRSWEEVAAQADRLASSATTLVGFVTSAGGAVPLAFEGLKAFSTALRTASDRAEFERVLREHADAVTDVLCAMREVSQAMFTQMQNNARSREQDALFDGRDDEAAALRRKPAEYRTLLADWVVLLNVTEGALGDLRAAVERGSVSGPDLADLTDWSEEIAARATAVKAAIVALRSGP